MGAHADPPTPTHTSMPSAHEQTWLSLARHCSAALRHCRAKWGALMDAYQTQTTSKGVRRRRTRGRWQKIAECRRQGMGWKSIVPCFQMHRCVCMSVMWIIQFFFCAVVIIDIVRKSRRRAPFIPAKVASWCIKQKKRSTSWVHKFKDLPRCGAGLALR